MPNYDFCENLSPIDFEILCQDLLEAELGIRFENFREGSDGGIDLRHAPSNGDGSIVVQCKRINSNNFAKLLITLKNEELPKLKKIDPQRYIVATSVKLSPNQADQIRSVMTPFIHSTDDVYGKERLNSLLRKFPNIERTHTKLWIGSVGVIDSIFNARSHSISRDEIQRSADASKIYVKNKSFDQAINILEKHKVCIISGGPGIGKTTLARMLLLYFARMKFEVVKIESDISEVRDISYDKKRFYYYDDFLGQTSLVDKLNKNEDQKIIEFLQVVQKSNSSIAVLTTREYILNQARMNYEKLDREKFNYRTCIIDLWSYSRKNKGLILYNHLYFSDIPREYYLKLITDRKYINIVDHRNYNPRLIEHLTSKNWLGETLPDDYGQLFMDTLDDPSELWEHVFENQLSIQAQTLLLVLVSMPTRVFLDDLKRTFQACHVTDASKASRRDFEKSLKELEGTFIENQKSSPGHIVQFSNPSIRDFLQKLVFSSFDVLHQLIDSAVFFEQLSWMVQVFADTKLKVPKTELRRHRERIGLRMVELFHAEKQRHVINVLGHDFPHVKSGLGSSPMERISQMTVITAGIKANEVRNFILKSLSSLSDAILNGDLDIEVCIRPLKEIISSGGVDNDVVTDICSNIRQIAIKDLGSLDSFELIKNIDDQINNIFSQEDIEEISDKYVVAVTDAVSNAKWEFDDDPDSLRELAGKMSDLDDFFEVSTMGEQDELTDLADEIEKKAEDDDSWKPIKREPISERDQDSCSDVELDDLFRTLGQVD